MDSTRLPIRTYAGAYTASGYTAGLPSVCAGEKRPPDRKVYEMHCFFKLRRGIIQRRPQTGEEWYGNR